MNSSNSRSADPEAGNGTANVNERSSLLPHGNHNIGGTIHEYEDNFRTKYVEHSNPIIAWPSKCLYTTVEVLKTNYVNILLVFVPIGIAAGMAGWDPVAVFILNFIAIIPLASLLAFATEELAVPLGQTLGGLLNATFGNAVELIVRIEPSFRVFSS